MASRRLARFRPFLATAALALWLGPARAWACPSCALGREDESLTLLAIGAFLLVPFAVAAVVLTVLRRLSSHPVDRSR
jgi:hypothetical protein